MPGNDDSTRIKPRPDLSDRTVIEPHRGLAPSPPLEETAIGPPPQLEEAAQPARRRSWRPAIVTTAIMIALVALIAFRGEMAAVAKMALATPPPTPTPTPEPMPTDPPLSPEVRQLVREAAQEEQDGRLANARKLYYDALVAEPECFSCFVRVRKLEKRMEQMVEESLASGARHLDAGNVDAAIRDFEKVKTLATDPRSSASIEANAGLRRARSLRDRR